MLLVWSSAISNQLTSSENGTDSKSATKATCSCQCSTSHDRFQQTHATVDKFFDIISDLLSQALNTSLLIH